MTMSNRKAMISGFVIGAVAVVAAAFFFYRSSTAPSPVPLPVAAKAVLPAGHPPSHPSDGNRPPSPHTFAAEQSPDAGTTLLAGTISLDPAISQSPGSPVTVFVIARSGAGKGHAVLARRFDAQSFPLQFALTGADSMMAGQKPDSVSIEARIDLDGDALTREPGSPTARLTSVPLGSKQISLTLKPEA
jgi:hypothetical protein